MWSSTTGQIIQSDKKASTNPGFRTIDVSFLVFTPLKSLTMPVLNAC